MNAIINFFQKLNSHLTQSNEKKVDQVFKFNGGVHPPENKTESTQLPIGQVKLPSKLILPLRQHVGNIPKVKVSVGEYVLKGQILAEAEGLVSAAIHAPTSGTVTAIAEAIIPHPSGLPDMCVTLIPDGLDEWIARAPAVNWRNSDKGDLVDSLRLSGIVGLGGATFPTHIKLRTNSKSEIYTLVINAAECEPYITCDDMLMRERADQIVKGIVIAQHLLGAEQCLIGIEENKPQAISAMQIACCNNESVQVKVVPTLYPSGDARRLIHLLLGTEIPSDKRSMDLGIQVFNVATVLALYRYFEFGEPAINRIVSMTGNVNRPQNFEVLFGTPLQDLITAAGGEKSGTTNYIMGGPMMGFSLPSTEVPITKATNCIIAAAPNLFGSPPPAMPCIRCARCADACPVSLQPQELYWFAKSENFEKARDYQLFDCIECGACSYVCPSNIPLVQYYRYAKSEIIAADKGKEAANLARERSEFKLLRTEREKIERTQRHALRTEAGKAETTKIYAGKAEGITAPFIDITDEKAYKVAKDVAIADAIERARALKAIAHAKTAEKMAEITSEKTEEEEKVAKRFAIAAAIERAKAQKDAALASGETPKNIEPTSKNVITEIAEIETRRKEFLSADKTNIKT